MILIESPTFTPLVIDLAKAETPTLESEITDFPVEDGADKTDHIRPRQTKLVLSDCVVSDSPIGVLAAAGSPTRAAEARTRLEELHASREPVTVGTAVKRWDNMALESVDFPRDADTGRALRFTLVFRQIALVTNNRATVRTSTPGAAREVDRGTLTSPDGPALDAISGASDLISDPKRELPAAFRGDSRATMRSDYRKSHPNGIVGPVGPFE